MPELDPNVCYRAVASRDRRFEGRFVVAVTTTGVYCRPGCPARLPRPQHARFFRCAAGAEDAGFRPCLRCRPETAPGSPGWLGTSATVSRALRLIHDGALDADGVEALAARLGMGARHLRRLFTVHLGASPLSIARTRRVHFAKRLIDETDLPMATLALAAGYDSLRSFNHAVRETFRRPPTALRRLRAGAAARDDGWLSLRLPYRAPFDWSGLLAFLRPRAIPGVEVVDGDSYRRSLALRSRAGFVEVRPVPDHRALQLRLSAGLAESLLDVAQAAGRVFDLEADPAPIAARLRRDPLLRPLVARRPGLRVPGAWDGFELAVRAILGQQVSVRAATTLAGRLAQGLGAPIAGAAEGGPGRLFPTPEALAGANLSGVGLTRARAETLRVLATEVAGGRLALDARNGADGVAAGLQAIPGIGEWTVQYLALRLGEPDAFPATDLGLRRALQARGGATARAGLLRRAEAWRPWRAYAVMHLWSGAGET